jgi:hypothetical protein
MQLWDACGKRILDYMRHQRRYVAIAVASTVFVAAGLAFANSDEAIPPPAPEPVIVDELPLPPTAPSSDVGSCTAAINPHGTGCMSASNMALQSGSYLPDGHHLLAMVQFAGAPNAPNPASIYSGLQIIIIKTDGTSFPNGDPWKCLTCGISSQNAVGIDNTRDYPQAFRDGSRALAGTNIIDCSPYLLTDDRCTPNRIHMFPIGWNVTADGSGPGGKIRELRLHPDNLHLGFNSFTYSGGTLGQFAYIGRLRFNPDPKTGVPRAPRYDLVNVTRLFRPGLEGEVLAPDPRHPGNLLFSKNAIAIGELRGFSKDGREVIYIGSPWESSNIDLFAADLETGKVRRLTSNPEYTDPMDSSPDDKWIVAMDTRGSNRQMFVAAMRGVPPVTDMLTTTAVSSIRNNGERRFFQPYLIDRYGDRGDYQGQQLNAGDGAPGSASDPNWNGMADPRWSPDGTNVAYWQSLVTRPACGGANPLACPKSSEPGGRRTRIMIAHLSSRMALVIPPAKPISDLIPWGTPYVPGSPMPARASIPAGEYILHGNVSGLARVRFTETAQHSGIDGVAVQYTDYSDDGAHIINGSESVTEVYPDPLTVSLDWHSDLVQTGTVHATKVTSPNGFKLTINMMTNIFQATGTLTTTVGDHVYRQPANGT